MRHFDLALESRGIYLSARCYKSLRSMREAIRLYSPKSYTPEVRGLCLMPCDDVVVILYTDSVPDWEMYLNHEIAHLSDDLLPRDQLHQRTKESEFRAYIASGFYAVLMDWHAKGCPGQGDFVPLAPGIESMDQGLTYVRPQDPLKGVVR